MKSIQQEFFSLIAFNPDTLAPLHSGIAMFNKRAELVYANEAYLNMYKLDPEHYVGIKATDLFITAEKGILEVLKTGKINCCTSITVSGYYGVTYRYPIKTPDGDVVGCLSENLSVGLNLQRVLELKRIINSFKSSSDSYSTVVAPKQLSDPVTFDNIIGESSAMRNLKNKGIRFAQNNEPILILGENGVGKDMFAQAIHNASTRCAKKFIAINCAAIPQDLMESELFGYEGGSFTGANTAGKKGKFEQADGGTIFLDEIGELPLHLQAKLLRVLENHEIQKLGSNKPIFVDFRLVSATNKNLGELVDRGEFREDLFYRLNLFELIIPPLRERLADIPLLVETMANKILGPVNAKKLQISPAVFSIFSTHYWRGNVRELRNVITYAIYSLGPGENILNIHHLPENFLSKTDNEFLKSTLTCPSQSNINAIRMRRTSISDQNKVDEAELIRQVLKESNGNKVLAARILGMARSNLYKKIKQYGLDCIYMKFGKR